MCVGTLQYILLLLLNMSTEPFTAGFHVAHGKVFGYSNSVFWDPLAVPVVAYLPSKILLFFYLIYILSQSMCHMIIRYTLSVSATIPYDSHLVFSLPFARLCFQVSPFHIYR